MSQACEILPKLDNDFIYLFYCRCRRSQGNPIIIKTDGKEYYARKVLFKDMGDFVLEFNKSPKEIARRGATTVLQFPVEDYTFRVIKKDDTCIVKGKLGASYTIYKS